MAKQNKVTNPNRKKPNNFERRKTAKSKGKLNLAMRREVLDEQGGMEILPASEPSPLETADRMTFKMNIHHEHLHEQPYSIEGGWSHFMETKESPMGKRLTVESSTPQEVNLSFMSSVGVIVIENRAGLNKSRTPTAEEREAVAKQIIIVSLGGGPGLIVRPGCLQIMEPVDSEVKLLLSTQGDPTEVKVHVFPK